MEKYYYELLKFIQDAPDTYISKEVIYNCLHWNYNKIDAVITDLLDNKCIDTFNINGVDKYKVNFKGQVFIKDFEENIITVERNNKIFNSSKSNTIKKFIFKFFNVLKSIISTLKDFLQLVLKK